MKQTTPPSPILPVFFLFFSLLLPAGNLTAASVDARQWEITADKITRYEENDLTTAAQELACMSGHCDI